MIVMMTGTKTVLLSVAVFLAHNPFVTAIGYGNAGSCPKPFKFGNGPPASCPPPADSNNKPASQLESWFTKEIDDLFPFANLGWGPSSCWPYSYEAFKIASRYPEFGTSINVNNTLRHLTASFAHAIQETGKNNIALYDTLSEEDASNCFYRGGSFNWFEGGPVSRFLDPKTPGYTPADGNSCSSAGQYCTDSPLISYFYPCSKNTTGNPAAPYKRCYFGRGAIQISYNYNYGQFREWLKSVNITVDLLNEPNLLMTKMDPPLAMMASLWFYMTPQPPKPAMHDIVMGNWNSGAENRAAGYTGPIFGPKSLIIHNECGGEDPQNPQKNQGIQMVLWILQRLNWRTTNSFMQNYQISWSSSWKNAPCDCVPANFAGLIYYDDPAYYPASFVAQNEINRQKCIASVYANPSMYVVDKTTACLNYKSPLN
ncbi:hypothetical protein L5515_006469 [Caenorhabditis briggsae]|uniref:Glycoside hydrolase family 19 catalytic domain-containing protein n=1 Tax=Caenorhabditis briggsae TaxID=6238 RepID=A0AAE9JI74_CAEBR|nr:hypothetical protein L5515_006469 [Caenorhabditis briggsae]